MTNPLPVLGTLTECPACGRGPYTVHAGWRVLPHGVDRKCRPSSDRVLRAVLDVPPVFGDDEPVTLHAVAGCFEVTSFSEIAALARVPVAHVRSQFAEMVRTGQLDPLGDDGFYVRDALRHAVEQIAGGGQ